MNQARPIPTKVRSLVPILGSPIDGEALAAARAIGRVLKREGLGFTDLATAIPAGETRRDNIPLERTAGRRETRSQGPIPPFDTYAFRRAYTPRQEEQHRARVRFCLSRPWSFSPRERAFLDGIARLRGNLTIRQGDWLAALADRLDQELRCA